MEKYIKYGTLILLAGIVSLMVYLSGEKTVEYSVKKEACLQSKLITELQPETNNPNNKQVFDEIQTEIIKKRSVTQPSRRYMTKILTKIYSGNISKIRNKCNQNLDYLIPESLRMYWNNPPVIALRKIII